MMKIPCLKFTLSSMDQVRCSQIRLNLSICHYHPISTYFNQYFNCLRSHRLEGTPFFGGCFRLKLVLSEDYPNTAPRGFFLTKIYHPNVAENGDICVNTLKKDWTTEVTLKHVFQVIRCLLIIPFPESSLNCEAGTSLPFIIRSFKKM